MAFLEPLDFVVTLGQSRLGTIVLSAPAVGDTFIQIVSADPSVLMVDAGITIPDGSSQGTFNVTPLMVSGTPINIIFSLNGEQVDAAITIDDPAVDSLPLIEHLDATRIFESGGPPVAIDGDVTVDDIELDANNGSYGGASLTVAIAGNDDLLSLPSTIAYAGGLISTGGGNLSVNGSVYASYTQAGGDISVTFTSIASRAFVNTVLQAFRYENTNASNNGPVTVDYTFDTGTQIVNGQISIVIHGANGPPIVDTPGNSATLTGTFSKETISGLDGNDTIVGVLKGDTLIGGAGNDSYVLADWTPAAIVELAGGGTDTVTSTISRSLATYSNVENLTLVNVATALIGTGNNFNNVITGNNFANTLTGNAGIDRLIGGAGNDKLFGGAGIDKLTGGLNNDFFVFNTALNAATNRDAVTDFVHGQDKLWLENAIFTKLGAGVHALSAAFFHAGAAAADANDYIVYNRATGVLSYDANGNAAGGAIAFAVLANHPVLAANDFLVI